MIERLILRFLGLFFLLPLLALVSHYGSFLANGIALQNADLAAVGRVIIAAAISIAVSYPFFRTEVALSFLAGRGLSSLFLQILWRLFLSSIVLILMLVVLLFLRAAPMIQNDLVEQIFLVSFALYCVFFIWFVIPGISFIFEQSSDPKPRPLRLDARFQPSSPSDPKRTSGWSPLTRVLSLALLVYIGLVYFGLAWAQFLPTQDYFNMVDGGRPFIFAFVVWVYIFILQRVHSEFRPGTLMGSFQGISFGIMGFLLIAIFWWSAVPGLATGAGAVHATFAGGSEGQARVVVLSVDRGRDLRECGGRARARPVGWENGFVYICGLPPQVHAEAQEGTVLVLSGTETRFGLLYRDAAIAPQ